MEFQIEAKNEDGSVAFSGTLNQIEAQFVLNVGINYLMAMGAFPYLDKNVAEHEAPEAIQ